MPLRRVLDLSWSLGGSYCTRLLSATGISVTKAEPPGGHWLRRWSASGAAGAAGALWGWLAGGQETMTVDPSDGRQTARLLDWAGGVDAVVWTPGSPLTAAGLIDVPAVRRAAGDGVVVALTPFGLEGPWAGRAATEFTLQALSGGPALRGSRDWPPMSAGGQHGEWMAGVVAAVAAMVGMHRRAAGGGGGVYDVSALEAVIMTQLFNPITGETMEDGRHPRRPKATVGDVHPSKDGYVGFAVVNRLEHWHQFCRMVGHPEWAEDASLDSVVERTERADELNPAIEEWTTARTTAQIVEVATRMRVPATEVGNGRSIPRMDHFASEGFYERNPAGGYLQPAPPWRFSPPIPGADQCRPAPAAPATVREVVPPPPGRPPGVPAGHTDPDRPLAGLRVADFTSFWAGPFLTHTLGMLGADVIHVESAYRPDGSRLMNYRARTDPRWWEWSAYFQATNTNKRAITLDMRAEAGRDLGRRLASSCDVVVENYSPRVLESWGITWEDLHASNPATIMVRMPAFGLHGPWRDRTGFAMTMEQVSGMAWLSGFPEHRPGALFGPCDPGAGLHTAVGLLAAIEHRRHTGRGMLVEAPMVAGALNVTAEQVIEYSAYGVLLSRDGNRGPAACPQNLYRTAATTPDGDQDRWVAVAVETDDQWRALVRAIGSPEWADRPALETVGGRRRHRDAIDERLAEWCASRVDTEIVDLLWPAGVPVAPVVHPIEQLGFDQLHARRFFESVDHPVCGPSIHVTYPFRMPGYEGPVHRRPAPTLGQHSDEILRDVLGLGADEIAALHDAGVVGEELTG